jgi:phage gpG-like protein
MPDLPLHDRPPRPPGIGPQARVRADPQLHHRSRHEAGPVKPWGRETRIKLLGGELIYRQKGDTIASMRRYLEGIKRRALNLAPVFLRFRDVWFEQNERVFAAEGLPTAWPALSPAYAAWKQRNFPGKTILRRTDRLFGSLTSMAPDTIFQATPRTLRMGSRVPYFMAHQVGAGNLPARPPLVLLPETFSELHMMVMDFVVEEPR